MKFGVSGSSPKSFKIPWGAEEWLELNNHYCYKIINIDSGYRTSLQYHQRKVETLFVKKGEAKILIDDEWFDVAEGDYFTIYPETQHRILAKTDLELLEVSTHEVDDVIRVEDDSNRPSGKIDSEHQ